MALLARSLALRGEAVFLIRGDRLVPVADWDLSTRDGLPRTYRLSIPKIGGGRSEIALAGEVLHFRLAADAAAPWAGQAPLRRASISAQLLHEIESALRDVFRTGRSGRRSSGWTRAGARRSRRCGAHCGAPVAALCWWST
jgi:phage portal protein BeeE